MSSDLPGLVGKERITAYDGTEYYNMLHSIQEMLQKHAIGGTLGKEQSKYISLSLFLTDLIYALKTDSAMLVVLPIPKATLIKFQRCEDKCFAAMVVQADEAA
ncbi:hypothetical protein, partial [Xanthomonas arboricola]